MSQLILIRGVPGSGKSTFARLLAKSLPQCVHIEADKVRNEWPGGREAFPWTKESNEGAHLECRMRCMEALADYHSVIVSNTFCEIHHLQKYFNIARHVERERGISITVTVVHVQGRHGSVWDNVNQQYYEDRWEEYKGECHGTP